MSIEEEVGWMKGTIWSKMYDSHFGRIWHEEEFIGWTQDYSIDKNKLSFEIIILWNQNSLSLD